MVTNKPGAPGRLRISVKTAAQGMPDDRLCLWYLPPAFLFAGGPWVRSSPGIPCALSPPMRALIRHHSGAMARRDRSVMRATMRVTRSTVVPASATSGIEIERAVSNQSLLIGYFVLHGLAPAMTTER